MTIYRVEHNKNYTVINNTICKDNRLSWKAKGIWLYAFSRRDDWVFHENDLLNQSTDGRDSLRAGLKELENTGYLRKDKQTTDEKGQFSDANWIFFETPFKINSPLTVFPSTEKPTSENPPIVNTDILANTEKGMNEDSFLPFSNEEEIRNLLNPYEPDEAIIKLALKRTSAEVRQALIAADQFCSKKEIKDKHPIINKAIFEKWKPNKNEDEIFEENKKFAQTLIAFDGKTSKTGWVFNIFSKFVEFNFSTQTKIVEFKDENFKKILNNLLNALEFA